MREQPFYHLRPNKYIDRELFVATLKALGRKRPLQKYIYCGFGSFYFDDFKMMHKLGVNHLISLEMDNDIYERAKFNNPYRCIDVIKSTSSDFIADFSPDENSHYIFWLDYNSPKEIRSQINDFSSLIQKLSSGDIVRITLNANLAALDTDKSERRLEEKRVDRLKELKKRLDPYVPADLTPERFSSAEYPDILLSVLKNVAFESLKESKYQKEFLLPLFSTKYADGQQMMTLTAIVLDDRALITQVTDEVHVLPFCVCNWEQIYQIQVPPLTAKEIIETNKKLPLAENEKAEVYEELKFIFGTHDQFESYVQFYQRYPNFQHVDL